MAKLTLTNLATLARSYINAGKIQIDKDTYDVDFNSYSKLIVKIGKQLMNDSDFKDNLPELDGEELRFGSTIEEYMISLIAAEDFDGVGADTLAPHDAPVEDPFYSKELAPKVWGVSQRENQYENSLLGDDEAAAFVAYLIKRLYDSFTVYKFAIKRQLIGELISRVPANDTNNAMIVEIAAPTDTATGEAFAKKVKEIHTELTEFENSKYNMANVAAISPEVVMYIKGSDILPVIDVDVEAGAFNVNKVEVPVNLKQLKDFGTLTANQKAYAAMFDPRGVKLHPTVFQSNSQYNAKGRFYNFFLHYQGTAYISRFTNLVIFVEPGA